ncbi:MAG TPA: hypothetical protein VHR18_00135 [Solirubrobacterales bacterium]|jgi:hypothetical protein|nr:hypothetical protein [Solirubrobacterales bacterium]
MRKSLLRTFAIAAVLLLVGAGSALALRLQVANIVIVTDGGFTPTTLPKKGYAPIKLNGHGRISTLDGALPPILDEIILWFDKHGEVETRGLPICTPGKLAATTVAVARKLCPGAIVGTGFGEAVVNFPEQPPIPASSPITIFNGAKKHGNPTVLAHAHLTVPAPTTFVVPIEIQRINKGRYGFKTVARIPKIAGGSGTPVYGRIKIGREWTYKGKRLSYVNAGCPDGRLQAKGEFTFKDGTPLSGVFLKRCTGR